MAGHSAHEDQHQVTAGEIAEDIHLESGRNTLHNYDLEPVEKHARVHSSSAIVKDKKTGKHYRKVEKPFYSLARSKGAARVEHSDYHGAAIGLGHSMPNSRRGSFDGNARGAQGSGSSNTGGGDFNAQLLNQIRLLIREEVQAANRGHADQLRQHMEDAIEKAVLPADEEVEGGKGDKSSPETRYKVNSASSADLALDGEEEEEEEELDFPNAWARVRHTMREPFAEFLACFILLTFGDGINVQVVASGLYDPSAAKGSYLSISFGWGIAVMMAIYTAGGECRGIRHLCRLRLEVY
jgi:aquaglyceroporin related protein